jgi:MATE family multidrug resistance protein
VFAAGLKGAGDTRYPLAATVLLGVVVMLGPAWLMVESFHAHVFVAWTAPTAYVVVLGLLMLRRFRSGRWQTMRVIEPVAAAS